MLTRRSSAGFVLVMSGVLTACASATAPSPGAEVTESPSWETGELALECAGDGEVALNTTYSSEVNADLAPSSPGEAMADYFSTSRGVEVAASEFSLRQTLDSDTELFGKATDGATRIIATVESLGKGSWGVTRIDACEPDLKTVGASGGESE